MEEAATRPVPIAIVGGGVVGLSMALALARQGIRATVFERNDRPSAHPRAHVANPRTLELFRLWGVEHEVRSAGLPAAATGNFMWLTALSGDRLGEVRYHRIDGPPRRDDVTQTPEVSCAQDEIEAILRRRLKEVTGQDVRYAAEVTAVRSNTPGGVSLAVAGETTPVHAQYVIAADGAGSPTRRHIGIGMEGPDELARFVSIYLHADLSRWTDAMPAVLYWIVNSRIQGVFISMDGRSRYVFHLRIDPARETFADYNPERCRALLLDAIGDHGVDVEIRQVGQWIMSGQVAKRYRAGNVFLVGDSAHRFPPTGGFGMNTGIQDAHNLAWKMAGVLNGWAAESLLDSYETERRPVADVNRSRSVSNFLRLSDLALWSLHPDQVVAGLEAAGPEGDANRNRFRAEVERQRDHFDKLFDELGFVYREGAIAPPVGLADGDASDPAPAGNTATARNAQLLDTVRVGARAPLSRMRRPDGGEVATTDLFEREFVLLAHGPGEWSAAAARVAQTGVPITCLQIGRDLVDIDASWPRISRTRPGGAVLVRPDGHVAFHCQGAPEDASAVLSAAMKVILRNNLG